MSYKVPAAQPYFSEEDIAFITERFADILRGRSFLTMHRYGSAFESAFASFIGTRHAVGCNSGTSALELIFRAMGVAGKEVIIPSNTFIATANAVLNAGGKVVFADCKDNMCMDADDAVARMTENTAAVCIVHISGIVSRDVLKLQKACRERNIFLVEDAAQAHGSALGGTNAGAFGTAAGFSFFSTKVMTTGEGGMVTTDSAELVEKMKSMREFGKVRKGVYINYHTSMGYNWRLPEVAALMGMRQLAALPAFIRRRQEIARLYDDALGAEEDIAVVRPDEPSGHNYFKYPVILPHHDRVAVHETLEAAGVQPSGYVYEIPLHKQPVFPGHHALSLPRTEFVAAHHLCLPIFYGMSDEQALYAATTLKKVLRQLPRKQPA